MNYATWPAFMIMIFFFMAHMNIKEAPAILLGSAFGIFNLVLIVYWFGVTVPLLGGDMIKYTDPHTVEAMFLSKLIYVALFVALIVFLKDVRNLVAQTKMLFDSFADIVKVGRFTGKVNLILLKISEYSINNPYIFGITLV